MKAIAKFFLVALLIGSTATASVASPIPGPWRSVTSVNAFDSDFYTTTLRGGEYTAITIIGDGDTDLNVAVYNAAGQRITGTTGRGDKFTLRFVPSASGTYRIEVRNHGGIHNNYRIEVQ